MIENPFLKLSTKEILKKYRLELVFNHAIYFYDLEETVVGTLAEDTNYMIRNYGKEDYSSAITIESIEENLELLKEIIKNNK